MDSVNETSENKGSMWDLDQKLDQPMDEEAGKLKNAYREKVTFNMLLYQKCLVCLLFVMVINTTFSM